MGFLACASGQWAGLGGKLARRLVFQGVEEESFDGAGHGRKFGLGEGDFESEVQVFDFARLSPVAAGLAVEELEAFRGDLSGQGDASGLVGFRVSREGVVNPVEDTFNDLADAGLGDF